MRIASNIIAFAVLLTALALPQNVQAQDKNKIKAKKALNENKPLNTLKLASKAVEKAPKDAEWWYLKCAAEYKLSTLPENQNAKSTYYKDAMKSATKARRFDENNRYQEDYAEVLRELSIKNNKEALANFGQQKYSKAIQLYKLSYELNGDTIAYSMLGQCYWADKDKIAALPILKEVVQWNFGAFSDSLHFNTFTREPFEILSNYYIEQGEVDSAMHISQMGLGLFPKNLILQKNLSDILVYRLEEESKGPIGPDFYQVVMLALEYFPEDEGWRYQQNAYFLYRLKNMLQKGSLGEADTVSLEFLQAKKSAFDRGIRVKGDVFLTSDTVNFYASLMDYFLKTNERKGITFSFKQWYIKSRKAQKFTPAMYDGLLKDIPASLSRRLVVALFEDAKQMGGISKLKEYRLKYYRFAKQQPGRLYDLIHLIELAEMVRKDHPNEPGLVADIRRFYVGTVDSAMARSDFSMAWKQFRRLKKEHADFGLLPAVEERLAKNDFYVNYYMTRIEYGMAEGKKVPLTGWEGNAKNCDYGFIPDSTYRKVFKRINYFRRAAGLEEEFVIAADRMEKCQQAAVMIDQKGLFTHSPSEETHLCYTVGAAEASSMGQMLKEGNPAQCVTVMMDDKKTESLINRRAILNPTGKFGGFGSTYSYSVFWLLDDLGKIDTGIYRNKAVCWPPAGFAPVYPQFSKWSFSLAAPLKGAKVKVKYKGQSKEVSVEHLKDSALIMETLVFEPGINAQEGDEIEVSVSRAGQKDYVYRVRFFGIPKP